MEEALEQKSREKLEREIVVLKRRLAEAYELIRKFSEQIEGTYIASAKYSPMLLF